MRGLVVLASFANGTDYRVLPAQVADGFERVQFAVK